MSREHHDPAAARGGDIAPCADPTAIGFPKAVLFDPATEARIV